MKCKNKVKSNYEVYRSMRRDWGNVNPVTRVIEDKRNKKDKHSKRAKERAMEE